MLFKSDGERIDEFLEDTNKGGKRRNKKEDENREKDVDDRIHETADKGRDA
ncbi:hypothetical protein QUF79_14470 [Fictibacillus enclensis]|uniref:hypothetical protein n=1 Tax=Fictibacillus enclensis TaxID=1017270 RepID=UPI0025A2C862|nr:hypothetical protein [Fictibacillus enclensis]MDM5199222.1 hypothetical protein [Fictibacillus enclensis]